MKYFICTDIHSFFDEWMEALNKNGFDINNSNHGIIVCGDLFDRGPKAKECYDFMNKLLKENRAVYIRGNHEDLLKSCYNSIGRRIESHHFSNGTVDTMCQFMNLTKWDLLSSVYKNKQLTDTIGSLLEWIDTYSVNCFELGDFIFVHGWIPVCVGDEGCDVIHKNWRDGDWKEARWSNGMDCWNMGLNIPYKTIVCGHWHTSWGHVYIEHENYNEFTNENEIMQKGFRPFIHPGIIALDSCVAHTHFVNCVIISNENEDGEWRLENG